MKRLLLLVILACSVTAQARQRFSGFCQNGGISPIVPGIGTLAQPVMVSYPYANVTVYLLGTLTPATIYADNSGGALSSTFPASADSSFFFYADNGRYDYRCSTNPSAPAGTPPIPTPFSRGDNLLLDPALLTSFSVINKTCYADQQVGVDAEAKIAACLPGGGGIGALPPTGGTIAATGFQGAQTWGAPLVIGTPVKLQLCGATFIYASGNGPMIRFDDSSDNKGDLIIEGCGMGGSLTASAVLANNTNNDTIFSHRTYGNGKLFARDLFITSSTIGNASKGCAIDIDYQDGGTTSVGFELRNISINNHRCGVRHVTGLITAIRSVSSGNNAVDGFLHMGTSSVIYDNPYAVSNGGNGYYLSSAYYPLPWSANQPYPLNARIAASPENGHRFKCTVAGTSGSSQPTWNTGGGATTTDGTVTWTEDGANAPEWAPSTAYGLNALIGAVPDNAHQYIVTVAGTSGTTIVPATYFPTGAGNTFSDGTVTWKENGASNSLFGGSPGATFNGAYCDNSGVDSYLIDNGGAVLNNIFADGSGYGRYGLHLKNPTFIVANFPGLGSSQAGSLHAIQIDAIAAAAASIDLISPSLAPRNNASVFGINASDASVQVHIYGGGFTGFAGNAINDPFGKFSCFMSDLCVPKTIIRSVLGTTNCLLGGAAGTASPAACGSAPSGRIAIPASQTTYTVNTSAVTANSTVIVQQSSDNSGLPSSPACSSTVDAPLQAARVAATSFTFTMTSVPSVMCYNYWIIN